MQEIYLTSDPSLTSPPTPLLEERGALKVRDLLGIFILCKFSNTYKLYLYPEYPRIRISPYFKGSTRRGRG